MPRKPLNLEGSIFGKLTAIARDNRDSRYWLCICECGNQKSVFGPHLTRNKIKSCGCLRKEWARLAFTTHGQTITCEYATWCRAKARCQNPNDKRYADYGGRGISMCARWLNSFPNFIADMGPRPLGTSLDRINVNGNYEPENCRWATTLQQRENRRDTVLIDYNGQSFTAVSLLRHCGHNRNRYKNYRHNHPEACILDALSIAAKIPKEQLKFHA